MEPKFQVNEIIRCRAGEPQYLEKGVNFFFSCSPAFLEASSAYFIPKKTLFKALYKSAI